MTDPKRTEVRNRVSEARSDSRRRGGMSQKDASSSDEGDAWFERNAGSAERQSRLPIRCCGCAGSRTGVGDCQRYACGGRLRGWCAVRGLPRTATANAAASIRRPRR